MTVEIEKRNGLTAITRIILTARLRPDSLSPGPTTTFTSGSAKIIIKILAAKVVSAKKLIKLELKSHADCLLPDAKRWLNTGIKDTLSAPDTSTKNMKSGIVKATV